MLQAERINNNNNNNNNKSGLKVGRYGIPSSQSLSHDRLRKAKGPPWQRTVLYLAASLNTDRGPDLP